MSGQKHNRRAIILGSILSLGLLTGCSIAREDMRSTYDYKVVAPGSKKEAIENELGSPDEVGQLENGNTRVVYSTSRVDEGTKRNLAATRMGLDLFTIGAFELMDPFAISEDQSKIFTVYFGPDDVALRVFAVCRNKESRRIIEIKPNPPYGISCTRFLQG